MSDPFKPLLDAAWERLQSKKASTSAEAVELVVWRYDVSPPFPSDWPLSSNPQLYYYAYATGFDLQGGLVDGVEVAAPWARVEVAPSSKVFS